MAQLAKESLSPPFDQIKDFRDEGGSWDHKAADKATGAWLKETQTELKKKNGDVVGEIVRFPAADGYAQYIVKSQKPLILQHLNVGDAWGVPYAHIRGLRLADIREQIEGDKRVAAMFPGS